MTSRWKFGNGNDGLARVAMGTVSGAIRWLKLSRCESADCSESEHACSTDSAIWEVERVTGPRRQNGALYEARREGVAPAVSRWWYAEKVVQANLGDHTVSSIVAQPFCWVLLVALPINPKGETAGKALCGVREARGISDARDSITLEERRGLTWCMPTLGSWRSPFPKG